MSNAATNTEGLLLSGLDGSNPLAFLAALGTLSVLTRTWPDSRIRMSWNQAGTTWHPTLHTGNHTDEQAVVETVNQHASVLDSLFPASLLERSRAEGPTNKKGEPKWGDKLRFPCSAFVEVLRQLLSDFDKRHAMLLAFVAAWASDAETEEVDKHVVATRTRFDFTAGNQALISMIRELRTSVTTEQLHRAIFEQWRYPTDTVSLRWDPLDEKRQYALQAVDPTDSTNNPIRSEPGANLLAIEGIAFYPLVPTAGGVRQPGFDRSTEGRFWTWPIWETALDANSVFSLLTLPSGISQGQKADLGRVREMDRARGIPQRYRSRIVMPSGRYRCFTPAEVV